MNWLADKPAQKIKALQIAGKAKFVPSPSGTEASTG
jgi:hypothetical protein